MTAWQPQHGERVIAVLPDGHEIEGWYWSKWSDRDGHSVNIGESGVEFVVVRTVKPLPITEPTAFGARVVDGEGRWWIRVSRRNGFWWRTWDDDRARVSLGADQPQPERRTT